MKKSIIILLSLVLSLSAFSCTHKKEYRVLEAGGYDESSDANHQAEIVLYATDLIQKEGVASEITTQINGKEYTLHYIGSYEQNIYQSDTDRYSFQENTDFVLVGINRKTGKKDSFTWYIKDYFDRKGDSAVDRDGCYRIAKEYLEQYTDADSYELLNERYREIPEYKGLYCFEFVRMKNGLQTSDRASIDVSVSGDVVSCIFSCLGEMKNIKVPSKSEMETIEQAVAAKLDQIYTLSDEFSYRHETQTVTLAKLKDGKRALIYDINVTKQSGDGETTYYSELCKLVVPLD